MSETELFGSSSARFGLPLLFSGQAQKEIFINEALSIIDALLHCLVEGEAATPPLDPSDGSVWIVAAGASGQWQARGGQLACRQAGNWLFVSPRDGMRVLDRGSGQMRMFLGTWKIAVAPSEPNGGAVVDSEARAAIHQILMAMRAASILPSG